MARWDPIQPPVPTTATASTRTSAHSQATMRPSLDGREPLPVFASVRAWGAAESCLVPGAVTFLPSIHASSSGDCHDTMPILKSQGQPHAQLQLLNSSPAMRHDVLVCATIVVSYRSHQVGYRADHSNGE